MMKVKFGDVVNRVNIKVDRHHTDRIYYVGGEHIESNELMIHDKGLIKGSTIGYKFHFGFNPRHILFMSRNPHLRKCSMVNFSGVCSDSTYVIETKDDSVLLQDYLLFEMQSDRFWKWAEEHKSGGVNYLINYATLSSYEFFLPSLSVQRELSKKLWAAYRLKESYKKLLLATRDMVKSQFVEMFGSHDTTPVGNYIEDSYPGEWGSEDIEGTGVKVIRTTNFTNTGKLDLKDVVTRSIADKKIERKTIHKYDTILERSGGTSDNPVGRVVLFEEDGIYLCNNFTQVLRFKNVDPRFAFYSLFYFYQTNKTKIRAMGSKSTGIQNLNMSKYLEIGIPNASEDEQSRFVSIADQADKSEFELKKSIEAIDAVIKSLINN
ncbi:restriction endonuclease subunit S [Sodaliphilus pleomorphus]|uniref:restriction endonuclease subunit S n=1 Tax=Sodaliphilus pleomorphus TaxID=2606626 RepID=UPI00240A540D|nr:restriction endonuclease subunit S [Sodaliphilus pleomorphus]MDD6688068.1 restriction endonuclease subunit S [Sodaliphilus pleomorphus]